MIKHLFIAALFVFLAACGSTPVQNEHLDWGFEGKFSLRSPQKNQSGYIQWKQYPNSYQVKLWGALGMGTTLIHGNKQRVVVDNGRDKVSFKHDDIIEIAPGFELPIGDIGRNANAILLNADPAAIQYFGHQDQWQAQTLRSLSYNDIARPIKVALKNTPQNTTITLLMKQWL